MLVRRIAIFGAAALALFPVALWIEHSTSLTLPPPTGPFPVGRTIADWTGDRRELLVWMWYPADPGHPVDDYIPTPLRPPPPAWPFRLLTRDLSKVHGHSTRSANVSSREPSYPVLIIRGGGSGPIADYSSLAEDLASHGYVVVGFDTPYLTRQVVFPDGRVIARKPENNPELYSGGELDRLAAKLQVEYLADVGFVLDRLKGINVRFDLTRVGVFGHSFGGDTAANFCAQDPRCKAGIDIDGALHGEVLQTGIHKPFMFLLSEAGDFSSDAEVRQIKADIQSVYDRLPPNSRKIVVIPGANHFMFSDDSALLKSRIVLRLLRVFGVIRIDPRRQLAITAKSVREFFYAYLT